jgi:hypothetical protein
MDHDGLFREIGIWRRALFACINTRTGAHPVMMLTKKSPATHIPRYAAVFLCMASMDLPHPHGYGFRPRSLKEVSSLAFNNALFIH